MNLTSEVRGVLAKLGVRPVGRRSQNFMVDRQALTDIASAACQQVSAAGVLEIGPGVGFLTRELLAQAPRVVAVEKDRVLAAYLREAYAGRPLEVVESDIIRLDPGRLSAVPDRVAGNIPYGITSPILDWLVGHRRIFKSAVLTLQWEVAERLAAVPGTKDWAPLTIYLSMYADVAVLRKIPRSSFYPSPDVDSALIRLQLRGEPRVDAGDEAHFFRIVRAAFQQRRKTLLNALRGAIPDRERAYWGEHLDRCGIDPMRRPETLTLEEWGKLSRDTAFLAEDPGR